MAPSPRWVGTLAVKGSGKAQRPRLASAVPAWEALGPDTPPPSSPSASERSSFESAARSSFESHTRSSMDGGARPISQDRIEIPASVDPADSGRQLFASRAVRAPPRLSAFETIAPWTSKVEEGQEPKVAP